MEGWLWRLCRQGGCAAAGGEPARSRAGHAGPAAALGRAGTPLPLVSTPNLVQYPWLQQVLSQMALFDLLPVN